MLAREWRRWLGIVYVLGALGLGTYWVATAGYISHVALMYEGPADITVDYRAAKAFHDGYNPFSPEGAVRSALVAHGAAGNAHPPSTSFWILPFTIWDLKAVQIAFGWGTLFLVLLQLLALARELECPAPIATAWLAFRISRHLPHGQIPPGGGTAFRLDRGFAVRRLAFQPPR